MNISLLVNTLNEEKRLAKCLSSAYDLVKEIVVVDMHSDDKTTEVARKFGAQVFVYQKEGYVEPARNFGIEKTTCPWVLILDADEEITSRLAQVIKTLVEKNDYDFFRLPRENLIFGKWIKYGGWWPDYQIRLFKKGCVSWNEKIHSVPITRGEGYDLPAEEASAIVHHNYSSINEYLERMNRYTTIEAFQLKKSNYQFSLPDLIRKPTDEFLGRFFARNGYKDGVHGFALALLQAFSFFATYLKAWENDKYPQLAENFLERVSPEIRRSAKDYRYWEMQKTQDLRSFFYRLFSKIKK